MQRFRRHGFDWIAWLLFATVPVVIFWQSATSLAAQGAASGGPLENAAFYPRMIATVMTVAVIVQGARLALGRVHHHVSPFEATEGTRLALAMTALFFTYLVLLPYVGFHLVTPIFLLCMVRALGVKLLPAVLGSVALWLGASFVFEGFLNVVLPVGAFNLTVFG
jgi:hypothetical protein